MEKTRSLQAVYSEMKGRVFTTQAGKSNLSQNLLHSLTASIVAPGPFYYFIFDCNQQESIFVSDSVTQFYEVHPQDFKISTIVENIHPDDVNHLMACESSGAKFMFKHIPKDDFPHYKVSHSYRVKTKDGKYKTILHQGLTFSLDSNGLMEKTMLVHTDISSITMDNNRKYSLIGLNGRPSFIGLDPYEELQLPIVEEVLFTNREIDILRLLSNGLSAKEIGQHLHISYNTVRTHKQNLLKKAHVKNSVELLSKTIGMKIF